jgi:hypothetical protein
MAAEPTENSVCESRLWLGNIPRDAFVHILHYLEPVDVIHLALTCREIRETLNDDNVWHCLCTALWSDEVRVLRLVASEDTLAPNVPSSSKGLSAKRAPRFKDAYVILRHLEKLRGLWRLIGEGKEAKLVTFHWDKDIMLGQNLVFVSGTGCPEYAPFCSFAPTLDVLRNIEYESGYDQVALRIDDAFTSIDRNNNSRSCSPSISTPHQRSTEVADVGFGTPRSFSSRDSPMYGTSPESSFRQAWSQFMSSSVQARSKMRRRSSRQVQFSSLRHLQRVVVPKPNRRHPLAGLWVADLDDGILEVILLSYNFRSSVASIVAKKLQGRGCLLPGDTIWKIQAASSTEWIPEEVELYRKMIQFGNIRSSPSGGYSSEGFDLDMHSLDLEDTPDVLCYHVGTSAYFGPDDEDSDDDGMFPCRLYVFSMDTIALFFVDNHEVVTMRRVTIDEQQSSKSL